MPADHMYCYQARKAQPDTSNIGASGTARCWPDPQHVVSLSRSKRGKTSLGRLHSPGLRQGLVLCTGPVHGSPMKFRVLGTLMDKQPPSILVHKAPFGCTPKLTTGNTLFCVLSLVLPRRQQRPSEIST